MITKLRASLLKIFPFWVFVLCFKLAAGLHFVLLSVLGERILPLWLVGILIGGAAFIQVLLDVPTGYLLDRFGYVRLLRIGTLFFIAGAAVFLFGLTPLTYILSIALGTVGWLIFAPGINAYVLLKAEKRNAGMFIATRDVAESIGIVLGTALLPIMITLAAPFVATIIILPFIVALVALFFTPLDRGSVHDERKIAHQGYYIRRHFIHRLFQVLRDCNPASTLLLLSGLSQGIFYGIIWFVVPLVLSHMANGGVLDFGLIVFDSSVLFVGFFIGRLTDTWDIRALVFWGLLLFAVSGLFLGFNFGVLFLVLGFLATTGDEMSSVSLWALLDHLDPDHEQDGLMTGAISLFQDLGWTLGPILAGFLYVLIGPSWTIAIGAICIFITWIVAMVALAGQKSLPKKLALAKSHGHRPRHAKHKR